MLESLLSKWELFSCISYVLVTILILLVYFICNLDFWYQVIYVITIFALFSLIYISDSRIVEIREIIEVTEQQEENEKRLLLEERAIQCLDVYEYKLVCYSDSDDDVVLARLRNGFYKGSIQLDEYNKTVILID